MNHHLITATVATFVVTAIALTALPGAPPTAQAAEPEVDPYAGMTMDFETADEDDGSDPTPSAASASKHSVPTKAVNIGVGVGTLNPSAGSKKPGRKSTHTRRSSTASLDTTTIDPTDVVTKSGLGSLMGHDFSRMHPVATRGKQPLQGAAVGRAIQNQLAQYERTDVRGCYLQSLKSSPELKGTWTVNFVVKTDGYTKQSTVRRKKGADAGFEQCLVRAATKWRFPAITESIDVQKTFTLSPRKD